MKGFGRILILIALLAIIGVLVVRYDLLTQFTVLLAWIEQAGFIGPLVFIALYIVVTVLFVPGSILTLGAGAVFGVVWGTVYVSIGSTLGATAAFLVGRYFLRSWVERKAAGSKRFQAIDGAIGAEGGKIIFLLRLSPLLPFNLSNYVYSLTKVKVGTYMVASWAGMLPGTVMYVYIGSLIKSLSEIGAERTRQPIEWILYGVGLVATIVGAIYVTRVAKRAISSRLHTDTATDATK